jgi:hypothetical protein
MKRGDIVYLKRPKRLIKAVLLATYDYPAARVRVRGEEKIVGADEVITTEGFERIQEQKTFAANRLLRERVANESRTKVLTDKWRPGMTSIQWRDANGWNIGEWSTVRRLKRLGIIA